MKGYVSLFAISIAADLAAKSMDIPVPGSILGLVGLVVWFVARGKIDAEIEVASGVLLKYLALLLVPVGVAVTDLVGGLNGALLAMVGVSVVAMMTAVLTTVGIVKAAKWLRIHRAFPAQS